MRSNVVNMIYPPLIMINGQNKGGGVIATPHSAPSASDRMTDLQSRYVTMKPIPTFLFCADIDPQ